MKPYIIMLMGQLSMQRRIFEWPREVLNHGDILAASTYLQPGAHVPECSAQASSWQKTEN